MISKLIANAIPVKLVIPPSSDTFILRFNMLRTKVAIPEITQVKIRNFGINALFFLFAIIASFCRAGLINLENLVEKH